MDAYVDMYNSLPTLGEADERFVQRDVIFAKLAPLLSSYHNQFGVCLVHSHCVLEPGEKMIGTGDVSQPRSADIPCYAERWLGNGEPIEFTTEETPSPPAELISEFQQIVGDSGVLGLYFSGLSASTLKLEWTEGRKNITKAIPKHDPGSIETAWLPGTKNPVQMACTIYCDSRTTRSGGYHKGTKSHIKS